MKKLLSLLLTLSLALSLAACGSDACESIELNKYEVTFTEEGDTFGLKVTTDPRDAKDDVEFESSDEDVAAINSRGLITAVGAGHATITVTCGDETEFCEVECDFGGTSRNDDDSDSRTDNDDDRDDRDDDDDNRNDDDDEEPTKTRCKTCGDRGVCPQCRGDYKCHACDGTGNCQRCDGNGRIACPSCKGELFECKYCGGDGKYGSYVESWCYSCSGTGRSCEYCRKGEGTIMCPDGCSYGYCPECDGDRVTCNYCNEGKCPDCT